MLCEYIHRQPKAMPLLALPASAVRWCPLAFSAFLFYCLERLFHVSQQPQVVMQRLMRMALAGCAPSAADQHEFCRMGTEKVAAFSEAWQAMALQSTLAQQQFVMAWWQHALNPLQWMQPWMRVMPSAHLAQKTWLDVMRKGMQPVHSRAVANAKRLNQRTAT